LVWSAGRSQKANWLPSAQAQSPAGTTFCQSDASAEPAAPDPGRGGIRSWHAAWAAWNSADSGSTPVPARDTPSGPGSGKSAMPFSRMHSAKACRFGSPVVVSSAGGSEDSCGGAVEQAANTAASMTTPAPAARCRLVCFIGVMPAP
jgi:hypothetical protein